MESSRLFKITKNQKGMDAKQHPAFIGITFPSLSPACRGQPAQNLTIGNAKALALANAVAADPSAIDSTHFNPAGLTQMRGRQYQLKIIGGSFEVAGELERSAEYQKVIDDSGFKNPVNTSKSSTDNVSAMLPFAGLTELPILLAPLRCFSITSS